MLSDESFRQEVTTFFDKIEGDDRAIAAVTTHLRHRFGVALAVFTLEDVADQVGRELTDEEKEKVLNDWYWYKAMEESMVERGFNVIADMILMLGIETVDGDSAGVCIYCRRPLVDDGVVLIDDTGGDACGVPLDNGSEHAHCTGFAYDPGADEESREVCSTCLCHRVDHPTTD